MTKDRQKKMAIWGLIVVAGAMTVTAVAAMSARSEPTTSGEATIGGRPRGSNAPAHDRARSRDLGLYIFPADRVDGKPG